MIRKETDPRRIDKSPKAYYHMGYNSEAVTLLTGPPEFPEL